MSTFNGIVKEFPDIRIDFFRHSKDHPKPALANFLSHVHSDHLAGLESCKAPFIYCSPATREILLRLEKYPHRMNFAKGILESRKQTYGHLRKLLKPIPLETPTDIELSPGKSIRVTLFDANHCVGAVSILVEGDGKAVFYTGDVRAEQWWVDSLKRHPLLIPYVSRPTGRSRKQLDCMYLDTTFATKDNPYRQFPSKAEGIAELLDHVAAFPRTTTFYFDSWTFGYEEVWMALSSHLDCQIHVDDYRYGLYRSLATGAEPRAAESARLFGVQIGNHFQRGCLTTAQTRLHSCERGAGCDVLSKDHVRITPIVSRYQGVEIAELGAGGGHGDLDQQHELELGDETVVGRLVQLCTSKLDSQPHLLKGIIDMLTSFLDKNVQRVALDPEAFNDDSGASSVGINDLARLDELPIECLVPAMMRMATNSKNGRSTSSSNHDYKETPQTQIKFPYSRHSSHSELCNLIQAFQPKDIWPCTVDSKNWRTAVSMSHVFGHLYNVPPIFVHDQIMLKQTRAPRRSVSRATSSGSKRKEAPSPETRPRFTHSPRKDMIVNPRDTEQVQSETTSKHSSPPRERNDLRGVSPESRHQVPGKRQSLETEPSSRLGHSSGPVKSSDARSAALRDLEEHIAFRAGAYEAALDREGYAWEQVGLVTVNGHQNREEEL